MPGPGGVALASDPGGGGGGVTGQAGPMAAKPWVLGLLPVLLLTELGGGGADTPSQTGPKQWCVPGPGQQPHHRWDRALMSSEEVMVGAELLTRACQSQRGEAWTGVWSDRSPSG